MAKQPGEFTMAVYDPPRSDLPYLTVMFTRDGEVQARACNTGDQAEQFVRSMASEAATRFNTTPWPT